jgi:acetyltransferase
MSLDPFFNPQSIAIVGASSRSGKVGYEILAGLIRDGYPGTIFPVNPTHPEVQGLKAYPDLKSIGTAPDLVVIVVSAKHVPATVQDCADLGVKALLVISSGFKESGPAGAELEQSILRIAKSAGIRIIGPNCIGIMVPSNKLNASFGGELPLAGGIGFFSQSGSLLAAIVDMARETGLGFSKLVSIGNKADVNELTLIRALGEDEDTKVIAGYLETISDGDAFIRQAERISLQKPILLMKAGFTEAGARAASSHTGRLAEVESAFECVFERPALCGANRSKTSLIMPGRLPSSRCGGGRAGGWGPLRAGGESWPQTPSNVKNCNWHSLRRRRRAVWRFRRNCQGPPALTIQLIYWAMHWRTDMSLRCVLFWMIRMSIRYWCC